MYTISLSYSTGDSFHTRDETSCISLQWNNKKLAREALLAIQQHYQLLEEDQRSHYFRGPPRSSNEIYSIVEKHSWHYNIKHNKREKRQLWKSSIAFEMDDGQWVTYGTGMWTGYFEQLYGGRVVSVERDDEDSFTI